MCQHSRAPDGLPGIICSLNGIIHHIYTEEYIIKLQIEK